MTPDGQRVGFSSDGPNRQPDIAIWNLAQFATATLGTIIDALSAESSAAKELTDLAEQKPNIANLNVTVREWADKIVFLHRIAPGAAISSVRFRLLNHCHFGAWSRI